MIFWRGKGFITILCLALGVFLVSVFKIRDKNMELGLMLSLAALFNFISLRIPFLMDPQREMVIKEDGTRVYLDFGGHFMFIPRKFWTFIFLVIGIILIVTSLIK